jgi:hypothetical protein
MDPVAEKNGARKRALSNSTSTLTGPGACR